MSGPAGGTITGRVLLEGNPVPYFGLRVLGERQNAYGGRPIEVRAADGRFTVPDVQPGTWRVAVMAPGTRMGTSRELTLAGGAIDVGDLELTRGQRLDGHVFDAAGAPVAGARVRVDTSARSAHRWTAIQRLFMGLYEVTTDEHGAYTFDGIDFDHEHVVNEIVWATHSRAGASVVHALPGADATLDFVLVSTGRIEGTVEHLQERRALVWTQRADEPPRSRWAACDHEGHFALLDLPPGEYTLRIDAPDAEPVAVAVVAGVTALVRLAMPSTTVSLELRVPVGCARDLAIEPAGEGAAILGRVRGWMKMGADERCSFEHVRPGCYRVSLDGSRWTTITVEPSPAKQTIDLRDLSHPRE